MTIQSVQAADPLLPVHQAPPSKEESLSKTDWKTHSLVVLSTLLIGIGVSLAVASIYFAVIVHPMAALLPAVPLILGVAMATEHDKRKPIKAPPSTVDPLTRYLQKQMQGMPYPIGIHNDSANCWINSVLQILSYLCQGQSSFRNRLQKAENLSPLFSAITHLEMEMNSSTPPAISSLNTQRLRLWLHNTIMPEAPIDEGRHVDSAELLVKILDAMQCTIPIEEQNIIKEKGKSDKKSIREAPYSLVALGMKPNKKESFMTLLKRFFYSGFESENEKIAREIGKSEESSDEGKTVETKKCLLSSPEDFFITLNRFTYNKSSKRTEKIHHPIDVSFSLELSESQCKSEDRKNYFVNAFIEHEGLSANSGHYIAYILVGKQWFLLSDHKEVKPISLTDAKKALERAYIIHYQQVPQSESIDVHLDEKQV
ncbi:MAG: hypothetical protein KR126chlam1_00250 [Chlamydiae bacterium]|nr:hypothetical protein [Chlamydiota bacterium]